MISALGIFDATACDLNSNEIVYSGKCIKWGFDIDTGHTVYKGYFSEFKTPGEYIIETSGQQSIPFIIDNNVFSEYLYLSGRVFYLSRSGIPIYDTDNSHIELEAGHTQPAVFWDNREESIDVSGGWYDAGDYGRYIPSGAFAVSQLLYAYRANPAFFKDGSLNIPESGNGIPDLLDEIRWEIEWMLKMQDKDGGVYNKVTSKNYPELGTLPEEDKSKLYVFETTSHDTADFVAVLAQAIPFFEPFDSTFSEKMKQAIDKSWNWLEKNSGVIPPGGFKNPPYNIYPSQAGYELIWSNENSHRMWAAAQMFQLTGLKKYEEKFKARFQRIADTQGTA